MRRRISNIAMAIFATLAVLSTGCGELAYMQADVAPEALSFEATQAPRPIADLSAASDSYTGRFVGLGISSIYPYDSSLDEAYTYDLFFSKDMGDALRFDLMLGYWDLPDKPTSSSDSSLVIMPVIASMQLTIRDIKLNRLYARVGLGYSINEYDVGSRDMALITTTTGTTYSAETSDAPLGQLGIGWETYPEGPGTIVTVEVLGTLSSFDLTEQFGESAPLVTGVDLNLLSLRLGLTTTF